MKGVMRNENEAKRIRINPAPHHASYDVLIVPGGIATALMSWPPGIKRRLLWNIQRSI